MSSIFQTKLWGEFQASIPSRGKYWFIENMLFIRHKLPYGFCWIECPMTSSQTIPAAIHEIAKKEKAIFLRIIPEIPKTDRINFPKEFHASTSHFPLATIQLDLTLTEDQLLAQMHPKCRYNIRVAERHGVKIINTVEKNLSHHLQNFYNLLQQTALRDGFHIHPIEYYEKMLQILGPDHAKLFMAYQDGADDIHNIHDANNQKTPVAGLIATYQNDTAIYYYGASSHEHRNFMAPYLLHWEVIKDAKNRGCKIYDLFGIAPPNSKNHPWSGITDFKKKFGGRVIEYHQPREKIYKSFLYLAYKIYKSCHWQ